MGKAWLNSIFNGTTLNENGGVLRDNRVYISSKHTFSQQNGKLNYDLYDGKGCTHYWKKNNSVWNSLKESTTFLNNQILHNKDNNLIVFSNKEYEHNSDDPFISVSGSGWWDFKIKTGNIIGYVKKGKYAIKITSRFGDRFLEYIIADADGFLELKDHGGTNDKHDFDWLLWYLWKIKLVKAFRLGLPKEYKTFKEQLPKVRGKIDPVDYFLNGQTGMYKVEYRNHSYNNMPVSLIAETFKKAKTTGHSFLNDMHSIRSATQIASEGKRVKQRELLGAKHFTNPYYHDYNPVIDLSKQLIQDGKANFGDQSDTSAFLFDVSMLFEYFVRKLLIREGFNLKTKKEDRMSIPDASKKGDRHLEPDILFEKNGKKFVFDVKYKSFHHDYGVNREDLFQMHTYAGQLGTNDDLGAFGLIYPLPKAKLTLTKRVIKSEATLMGKKVPFYVFFIVVPEEPEKPKYEKYHKKDKKSKGDVKAENEQKDKEYSKSIENFDSEFEANIGKFILAFDRTFASASAKQINKTHE